MAGCENGEGPLFWREPRFVTGEIAHAPIRDAAPVGDERIEALFLHEPRAASDAIAELIDCDAHDASLELV